ncbi:MAG: GerMN domain-containing protein [Treponema sp.]|nr:GerMN domain-containing protein [Treponema sp.]
MSPRDIIRTLASSFESKRKRRLLGLVLLGLAAVTEFFILGLARRTFVFYNVSGGVVVEDRMLKRSPSREVNITRYLGETLLGPAAPDLAPLFPRGTTLKSALYRDGVVYADFSADAALPPVEGGRVLDNFRTLYAGILRNFPFVREVRFFIDGNAAYDGEFRQEGGVYAEADLGGEEEGTEGID